MTERETWRLRPVITAAIGLVAAVIVQQLTDGANAGVYRPPTPNQVSIATGIGIAAVLAIFTLECVRAVWAVVFAIAVGVVAGFVTWWSGAPSDGEIFIPWRSGFLFLAIAIAAPLFQTARDAGARRFDYAEVHGHVWTNLVVWAVGMAFMGVAFALAYLLSALFDLIGIHVLRDLLKHGWANAALAGAAFGGAVGLMRERDRIVRTLQRVVTAILSVLAPVLGAGLILFLLALPFTGLSALWEATKSTTPILLSSVIGAFVLANAVIGDGDEDAASNPALRWGAMALGLAMLPLAVIAALATGLRIGQYGFTPDRLWALTVVIVACAYGLAYLVALVRRRARWADAVRPANLTLAFALMGVALLLATPIVSFNAIATRDQVARLTSGRTAPDRFDWAALAFDFGAPGKAALAQLTRSSNAIVARIARDTLAKPQRYDVTDYAAEASRRDTLARRLRVVPVQIALPPALIAGIVEERACGWDASSTCVVVYTAGATEAVAMLSACLNDARSDRAMTVALNCGVSRLVLEGGRWKDAPVTDDAPRSNAERQRMRQAVADGAVEIRSVTRRQLYVGGQPVGDSFQ